LYDATYVIPYDEHVAKYDGFSTTQKLNMLGIPKSDHEKIWKQKQNVTQKYILENFVNDERICSILEQLKNDGYTIHCASNSIWQTIKNTLTKKGFIQYIDYFVSNECVKNPKPSPDMYFKCFERAGVSPKDAIVFEDSPIGLAAARMSGAQVIQIYNPDDLTIDKIYGAVSHRKVNIVIPAAGIGSRFKDAGYDLPKPLIKINNTPLLQIVVQNLDVSGQFIFILQKEHVEKYNMELFLNAIAPGCKIVTTDGLTAGSVSSVLLATDLIDNDTPLIIANSDQYIDWDPEHFIFSAHGVDGCISTFTSTNPKFSFAKVDEKGLVTEVAEKIAISDIATTGVYYWKCGSDYVKYANMMIQKNIRVNGEFYNCPVFNEAIQDGLRIKTYHSEHFYCLGTPEDLSEIKDNMLL
jgi:HAD superfamily hydrolase (TIGR01509 family)